MLGRAMFKSDEEYLEQFDQLEWRGKYDAWRAAILNDDSNAKDEIQLWFSEHPHPNDLRVARNYQGYSPGLGVKKLTNLLKF